MIALSDLGCLQGAFSTLVGVFDWVGLKTNVGKTVGMVQFPCQAAGTPSDAGYEWWMAGTILSYQKRQ